MTINEAYRQASELNREQEARGSQTRYIVLTHPMSSVSSDPQVVPRRVGGPACRTSRRS